MHPVPKIDSIMEYHHTHIHTYIYAHDCVLIYLGYRWAVHTSNKYNNVYLYIYVILMDYYPGEDPNINIDAQNFRHHQKGFSTFCQVLTPQL